MKKYLSLLLALVLVVTAIPFAAINASAAERLYMGDTDGNGSVTAMDARMVLQVVGGLKPIEADVLARVDMNGDGNLTAIDARWILQTAAGSRELVPATKEPTTQEQLNDILHRFGYVYDAEQNIFYTHLNPWQRYFGFSDLYDNAAAYTMMWYMTLKIDFEYEDLLWRLQWWKGQYGVLEGAELGVYTKKPENVNSPFYKCAEDENLLEMYFEYYHTAADYNKGEPLFTRYEQEHWWLTGFKFGVCDPEKNVLKAYVIAWDDEMADGIEEGLKNVTDKNGNKNGFVEYKPWMPSILQGNNFYIREALEDGRIKFTVVWKDAGYLNYGDPENPEGETPDEPEVPDVPETPDEPEVPDVPETPDEPEVPDVPETPDEPEVPDIPETPDEPEIPDVPETPDVPEENVTEE